VLPGEHAMLIRGVPGAVVRKRIHDEHVGLTERVEGHAGNETIFALEEVAVRTKLVFIFLSEDQNLVIILPALARSVNVFEHLQECRVLDQFIDDDCDTIEGYHLIKQSPEVNFLTYNYIPFLEKSQETYAYIE